MDMAELAAAIKQRAAELGFDLCGIAPAQPSVFKAEFRAWLDAGYHGEMAYIARDPERRLDPTQVLPGARSIVVVAMNYYTESEADTDDPTRAVFARYARNDDYHDVMTPRLRELLAWVKETCPHVPTTDDGRRTTDEGPTVRSNSALSTGHLPSTPQNSELRTQNSPPPTDGRVYVDTGPILEREVARLAGIGWFGKNTMLINTRRGSYFLLGEILLNLPLPPDGPAAGGCGTCRACIDACPTQAIVEPYKLDARRCISYLTIELKGPMPEEFHGKLGNRIFGCDICQEVCPFNQRRATPTDEPAFQPRESTRAPLLTDLARMNEEQFREAFRHSPVRRAKWRGLVRNIVAAASALNEPETRTALQQLWTIRKG